jgi:high-affinity iron transporter
LNSGNYFVLALVSFMAVFREAFEVVLFLRAIWIDLDTTGQTSASLGILSSTVLLSGFAFLAVKQGRRLPLGLLFRVCSWTMIGLAFILAGKGVHSLQEAGILTVSSLPFNPRIDLVGVFPTMETVAAQVVLVGIFAGLMLFERKAKSVVAT